MKKKLLSAVALIMVAAFMVALAISPGAKSPVIDQSYGAQLDAKDSSPSTVEILSVERVETLPKSEALVLLSSPAASGSAAAGSAQGSKVKQAEVKQIPLDENADVGSSQAVFETNLKTLMAGDSKVEFVEFLEKTYKNTEVILLLDFAEFLMGESNPIKSIVDLLDWIKNGVNDFRISMVDVKGANRAANAPKQAGGSTIQEFYFHFSDNNGTQYTLATGVYWDADNKLLYGKDEKGLFALGYDLDVKKLMLYTPVNAWQRNFGFSALYDFFAPLVNMDYVTARVKFEYGDYAWMVQIWKGRYTVGIGSEIGLYYKDKNNAMDFYQCATDDMMIPMTMQLYFNDLLLMDREEMHHWWMAGFVLVPIYIPQMLTLKGSLTFQSKGMADEFFKASKTATSNPSIEAVQNGKKVSFTW